MMGFKGSVFLGVGRSWKNASEKNTDDGAENAEQVSTETFARRKDAAPQIKRGKESPSRAKLNFFSSKPVHPVQGDVDEPQALSTPAPRQHSSLAVQNDGIKTPAYSERAVPHGILAGTAHSGGHFLPCPAGARGALPPQPLAAVHPLLMSFVENTRKLNLLGAQELSNQLCSHHLWPPQARALREGLDIVCSAIRTTASPPPLFGAGPASLLLQYYMLTRQLLLDVHLACASRTLLQEPAFSVALVLAGAEAEAVTRHPHLAELSRRRSSAVADDVDSAWVVLCLGVADGVQQKRLGAEMTGKLKAVVDSWGRPGRGWGRTECEKLLELLSRLLTAHRAEEIVALAGSVGQQNNGQASDEEWAQLEGMLARAMASSDGAAAAAVLRSIRGMPTGIQPDQVGLQWKGLPVGHADVAKWVLRAARVDPLVRSMVMSDIDASLAAVASGHVSRFLEAEGRGAGGDCWKEETLAGMLNRIEVFAAAVAASLGKGGAGGKMGDVPLPDGSRDDDGRKMEWHDTDAYGSEEGEVEEIEMEPEVQEEERDEKQEEEETKGNVGEVKEVVDDADPTPARANEEREREKVQEREREREERERERERRQRRAQEEAAMREAQARLQAARGGEGRALGRPAAGASERQRDDAPEEGQGQRQTAEPPGETQQGVGPLPAAAPAPVAATARGLHEGAEIKPRGGLWRMLYGRRATPTRAAGSSEQQAPGRAVSAAGRQGHHRLWGRRATKAEATTHAATPVGPQQSARRAPQAVASGPSSVHQSLVARAQTAGGEGHHCGDVQQQRRQRQQQAQEELGQWMQAMGRPQGDASVTRQASSAPRGSLVPRQMSSSSDVSDFDLPGHRWMGSATPLILPGRREGELSTPRSMFDEFEAPFGAYRGGLMSASNTPLHPSTGFVSASNTPLHPLTGFVSASNTPLRPYAADPAFHGSHRTALHGFSLAAVPASAPTTPRYGPSLATSAGMIPARNTIAGPALHMLPHQQGVSGQRTPATGAAALYAGMRQAGAQVGGGTVAAAQQHQQQQQEDALASASLAKLRARVAAAALAPPVGVGRQGPAPWPAAAVGPRRAVSLRPGDAAAMAAAQAATAAWQVKGAGRLGGATAGGGAAVAAAAAAGGGGGPAASGASLGGGVGSDGGAAVAAGSLEGPARKGPFASSLGVVRESDSVESDSSAAAAAAAAALAASNTAPPAGAPSEEGASSVRGGRASDSEEEGKRMVKSGAGNQSEATSLERDSERSSNSSSNASSGGNTGSSGSGEALRTSASLTAVNGAGQGADMQRRFRATLTGRMARSLSMQVGQEATNRGGFKSGSPGETAGGVERTPSPGVLKTGRSVDRSSSLQRAARNLRVTFSETAVVLNDKDLEQIEVGLKTGEELCESAVAQKIRASRAIVAQGRQGAAGGQDAHPMMQTSQNAFIQAAPFSPRHTPYLNAPPTGPSIAPPAPQIFLPPPSPTHPSLQPRSPSPGGPPFHPLPHPSLLPSPTQGPVSLPPGGASSALLSAMPVAGPLPFAPPPARLQRNGSAFESPDTTGAAAASILPHSWSAGQPRAVPRHFSAAPSMSPLPPPAFYAATAAATASNSAASTGATRPPPAAAVPAPAAGFASHGSAVGGATSRTLQRGSSISSLSSLPASAYTPRLHGLSPTVPRSAGTFHGAAMAAAAAANSPAGGDGRGFYGAGGAVLRLQSLPGAGGAGAGGFPGGLVVEGESEARIRRGVMASPQAARGQQQPSLFAASPGRGAPRGIPTRI